MKSLRIPEYSLPELWFYRVLAALEDEREGRRINNRSSSSPLTRLIGFIQTNRDEGSITALSTAVTEAIIRQQFPIDLKNLRNLCWLVEASKGVLRAPLLQEALMSCLERIQNVETRLHLFHALLACGYNPGVRKIIEEKALRETYPLAWVWLVGRVGHTARALKELKILLKKGKVEFHIHNFYMHATLWKTCLKGTLFEKELREWLQFFSPKNQETLWKLLDTPRKK